MRRQEACMLLYVHVIEYLVFGKAASIFDSQLDIVSGCSNFHVSVTHLVHNILRPNRVLDLFKLLLQLSQSIHNLDPILHGCKDRSIFR